ncbi:MAG: hypothetical protein ACKOE2_15820 [Actinomycetales bacterium]
MALPPGEQLVDAGDQAVPGPRVPAMPVGPVEDRDHLVIEAEAIGQPQCGIGRSLHRHDQCPGSAAPVAHQAGRDGRRDPGGEDVVGIAERPVHVEEQGTHPARRMGLGIAHGSRVPHRASIGSQGP